MGNYPSRTFSIELILASYLGLASLTTASGYYVSHLLNATILLLITYTLISRNQIVLKKEFGAYCVILTLLVLAGVASSANGYGSFNVVKYITYFTPVVLILYLSNYKFNFHILIKYWFIIGCFTSFLITTFLADFNPRINKFYATIPGFELSSNGLSLHLITSVVLPGLLLLKSRVLILILLAVPLIHFSKAHLVFYFLSLALSFVIWRKKIILAFILIFVVMLIFTLIGANYDYLSGIIPPAYERSFGKILLSAKLFYGFFTENSQIGVIQFISSVGDPTRAFIYERAIGNLLTAFPFGASKLQVESIFLSYDYHNMPLYFYFETGVFGLLFYLFCSLYPIKIKLPGLIRFVVVFSCFYIFFRGLFMSVDPVRTFIIFSVLLFYGFSFKKSF